MIVKAFTMFIYKDIPKWKADLKCIKYLELLGYKVEQDERDEYVIFNFYRKEEELSERGRGLNE